MLTSISKIHIPLSQIQGERMRECGGAKNESDVRVNVKEEEAPVS